MGTTFQDAARRQFVFLLFLLMLPSTLARAQTGTCSSGSATQFLDVAGVRAALFDNGHQFWNGLQPTYNVPAGTNGNAIFSTALWVGGMVNGELRVSASDYGAWEMWPGPLDDNGNPPADCSSYDHMYKVGYNDVLAYDTTGFATDDLAAWPFQLGAPVKDGDGDPNNYNLAGGDRPELEGHQDVWWIMNDAGNEHPSQTLPIQMEVRVTAFAAASENPVVNLATLYRYRFTYKGSAPFENAYVGMFVDADVGDATDDLVGSDTALGLAYTWNGDDFDDGSVGYGDRPPAIGYTVLEGILADTDGIDNNEDGQIDEEGERIGMSKFVYFQNDLSATGNPQGAGDYYRYLHGLWLDDAPVTFGGSGRGFSNSPVDFMYPGNPPDFWSEEDTDGNGSRNQPGDRRFVWSVGPFNMAPGETKDLVVGIVFAQGDDRYESVQLLKEATAELQAIYSDGFQIPFPNRPAAAPDLLAPGNGATGQPRNALLSWDEVPGANTYEVEIGEDVGRDLPIFSTREVDLTQFTATLNPLSRYLWRVRGVNLTGKGPWSEQYSFLTSPTPLIGGGVEMVFDAPAFIQIQGIGDDDACGPAAGSTLGCNEVGGNLVYQSYNGQLDWIMGSEGDGPEVTLPDFAPEDYEIRFTEEGSYAYHLFTTGAAISVPFEIWDIGRTGPFGVNDPADDVRMIPAILSQNGGECVFGFGEVAQDPFGLGWPLTDRIYAYYPTTDYASWEAAIEPVVSSDPNGCPVAPETDAAAQLIDQGRGRPLQRLVFAMNPSDPDYRDVGIPVGNIIRFLTTGDAGVKPVPSAPSDGASVSDNVTLRWQTADIHVDFDVQIARDQAFTDLVASADNVPASSYSLLVDPDVTYYWRVRGRSAAGRVSGWSEVWRFSTVSGVGVERDQGELPLVQQLLPNYPNPFKGSTTIRFGLPVADHVRLAVYDLLGRRIRLLTDRRLQAGWHSVGFDASGLSSGVYLYRLDTSGPTLSGKMVLSR